MTTGQEVFPYATVLHRNLAELWNNNLRFLEAKGLSQTIKMGSSFAGLGMFFETATRNLPDEYFDEFLDGILRTRQELR